jgi:uncharacterized protein YggL (DUF469 family)
VSAPCPVFGFRVQITLPPTAADDSSRAIADSLFEILDANGLVKVGGGNRLIELTVNRQGAQATDADRQLVIDWAAQWTHTADVRVSDLIDLNADD